MPIKYNFANTINNPTPWSPQVTDATGMSLSVGGLGFKYPGGQVQWSNSTNRFEPVGALQPLSTPSATPNTSASNFISSLASSGNNGGGIVVEEYLPQVTKTDQKSNKWLMDQLAPAFSSYGGGIFGTSFLDQYRNGRAGMQKLDSLVDLGLLAPDSQQYADAKKAAQSMKGSAIAGGVIAGLTGAAQIAGNVANATRINDTSYYSNQIDRLNEAGAYTYNNYDQLADDYNNTQFNVNINKDDIRGMNNWQKAGNIGSSALTGATTGMSIAGPWGAAIGGLVGGAAGWLGVQEGNRKADIQYASLQNDARRAAENAQSNFRAAHENIADRNFRHGVANVAAGGGRIERRQQSLLEFAERVTRKQRLNDRTHSAGITRQHCKGGTMVRLKMK